MLWIIGVLFLCAIILYGTNKNQFFKKRGIRYLKPHLFVGNMLNVVLGREHLLKMLNRAYNLRRNDKYVGIFSFMSPIVLIKDMEIIKQILVKDFDHFTDHMKLVDENADPILSKVLFFLEGEKWKDMRNALSPAFTSSKLRTMFPFMAECAENFIDYLNTESLKPKSLKDGYTEYNTKDLISHYSNDVIASCAFGYKINSLEDKDDVFYKMAKSFNQPTLTERLKMFAYLFMPSIVRVFNIELGERGPKDFFRNITLDAIKIREESGMVRPDMIHLLILAKQGKLDYEIDGESKNPSNKTSKKIDYSDEEIVGQALMFLIAGLDTTSSSLSFLFNELAKNPDVQIKLQEEIDAFILENDGKVEYKKMSDLKYLDMVISENLRIWPIVPYLDRLCVKPYTLPPQNDATSNRHQINKGETIWISMYDILKNPQYFENPDQFIPERFSEDNKANIQPCTYLPFGFGPRQCIGNRFALIVMKVFIVYVLANYNLIPTPNTVLNMKIKPGYLDMYPEGGFHIGFQRRDKPMNIYRNKEIFL